jgi:hypothetical protein
LIQKKIDDHNYKQKLPTANKKRIKITDIIIQIRTVIIFILGMGRENPSNTIHILQKKVIKSYFSTISYQYKEITISTMLQDNERIA